jgi:Holliday junction resolvase-like predicted endonuclease
LRIGRGELDLVVAFGGARAAVEVKTAAMASRGDPIDRFDAQKLDQVRKLAAARGIYRVDYVGVRVGFDGVAVRWLPNVF